MTSAREQARERALHDPIDGLPYESIAVVSVVRQAADAASDVWEPLLQDAYLALRVHAGFMDSFDLTDEQQAAVTRALIVVSQEPDRYEARAEKARQEWLAEREAHDG